MVCRYHPSSIPRRSLTYNVVKLAQCHRQVSRVSQPLRVLRTLRGFARFASLTLARERPSQFNATQKRARVGGEMSVVQEGLCGARCQRSRVGAQPFLNTVGIVFEWGGYIPRHWYSEAPQAPPPWLTFLSRFPHVVIIVLTSDASRGRKHP